MIESHGSSEKPTEPRPAGGAAAEAQRDKVQKQLDDALAASFPASDPVSIVTSHQEDWDQLESK
jgi:hypothetical protein